MVRGSERFPVYRNLEKPSELSSKSQKEEKNERFLPVKSVAEQTPLSVSRIRELLKEGKIKGELRLEEGFGKGLWYTSIAEVERYKQEFTIHKKQGPNELRRWAKIQREHPWLVNLTLLEIKPLHFQKYKTIRSVAGHRAFNQDLNLFKTTFNLVLTK